MDVDQKCARVQLQTELLLEKLESDIPEYRLIIEQVNQFCVWTMMIIEATLRRR